MTESFLTRPGSSGELVQPVAKEGGFSRAERESGPVRGVEGGIESEGPGGETGVRGRGGSVVRESSILAEISGSRSWAGAPISHRVTPVTAARQRRAARAGGTRRRPAAAARSKNFSRRSLASSAAGGRRPGRSVPYI